MKSIERLVKRHQEDTGFGRVESLYESYYILPDGTFLGCNYDFGMRGDDHRMIFIATDLERNDWEGLHKAYRLIRFVPESNMALIKGRQRLTEEQKMVIDEYGLEVERY
ncbi:hypothetical protein P5F19_14120 [Clostridium perfringens]|uniref:hypothetical protein n=1 Tax=Clostridium perfringens TaxID=1502 RepID=UPI0034A2403D|nr:hypothetical protein [Clostridium perfringens]